MNKHYIGVCAMALAFAGNGWAQSAEVSSFVATVTDFRTSLQSRSKLLTATVQFKNKTNGPLILGYVNNSGVATDDQGNRYVVHGDNAVRAIGIIGSNGLDPKFVLQPGEASDARFEFAWNASGREIHGTNFELDFTVRELTPLQGRQYRLGREHALHIRGLGQASQPAPPPAATTTAAPVPVRQTSQPFTADVEQVRASRIGNFKDHLIRMQIRFRNITDQPVILGYKSGSGAMMDNLGNQYYWGRAGTVDGSVSGMGTVTRSKADPQFVLNPGETRSASFQMIRYRPGNSQIGTSFTYDVVIEQLEVLPSQQIRSVRDYSLNFPDLRPVGGVAAPSSVSDINDTAQKIRGLFRKK